MNDPDDPGRKVPDEGSSISEQLVAEIQEYLQEHYDVGGEREVPAPTPSPLPLAGEPPRRAAGSPAIERNLFVPAVAVALAAALGIIGFLYFRSGDADPARPAGAETEPPPSRQAMPADETQSLGPEEVSPPEPADEPLPGDDEGPGEVTRKTSAPADPARALDGGELERPAELERSPEASATVASEEDFVTCQGVERQNGRPARPLGVTDEFPPGLVHLFGRIRSPGSESLKLHWVAADGSVLRARTFQVQRNLAPGYRIYFTKNFQQPGEYEARLFNSGGDLIARRPFRISG